MRMVLRVVHAAVFVLVGSVLAFPETALGGDGNKLSWGLAATMGYRSPILGGEMFFSLPVAEMARVSLHGGVGWNPDIQVFDEPTTGDVFGWAAGLEASYGRSHAGLVDVSVGGNAHIDMDCDYHTVAELVPWLAVAAGYRYTFGFGLFLRAAGGAMILMEDAPVCSHFDQVSPIFDVAVGFIL